MKTSTKEQVQGKLHEVRGTLKEKAGQIINSPSLEAEGQKVQQKVGAGWAESQPGPALGMFGVILSATGKPKMEIPV